MRIYRVTARSTVQGQEVVNTWHVATDKGTSLWSWPLDTTASPQDVADHFDTKLTALYRAMVTTDGLFHGWTVTDEHDPADPQKVPEAATKAVELAGTRSNTTGTECPLELCGMARLSTGKGGRSFRGRSFLPPVVERAQITDQNLGSGSYWTACTAFITELTKGFADQSGWLTPWSSWDANIVVYSRHRRVQQLDTFIAPVKSASMDARAHWLRSRRP